MYWKFVTVIKNALIEKKYDTEFRLVVVSKFITCLCSSYPFRGQASGIKDQLDRGITVNCFKLVDTCDTFFKNYQKRSKTICQIQSKSG